MKVDKYDRQIRLWGARGQRRLGESKVALFGCNGAGIEGLKNLILPGVGHIDIWDDKNITVEDLSQSFFFDYQSVGQGKAQVASRNLLEMNPDVQGKHYSMGFKEFIEGSHSKNYSLVIFSGLCDEQASVASKSLWELKIPCIFVNTVGFFFYVRLQKEIHFVESSNTNSKKYYMRITDPFPQLLEHATKHNIYQIAERVHKAQNYEQSKEDLRIISNIPYVLLLIQVYKNLPENGRTRQKIIEQLKMLKEKIHQNFRQNFDQALTRILDIYQSPENFMVDINILEHPEVQKATKQSHTLLRFLNAVAKFYKESGKLPQPTVLPDMHTTTVNYIQLKDVYKQEHQSDIKKLLHFMGEGVDEGLVSEYINNLENLQMVEMTPFCKELENPDTMMLNYLHNQKDILISLRAYRDSSESYEDLLARALQLKEKYGINQFDERFLKEFYRGEGKTNINICSMAGAVVGQEAIKLITGCFSPANSGYMFDGAQGHGYQVKL